MTDSIRVPLGDLRALAEKATPGPWAAPLDCAPEDRTVIRGTDIHATRDDGPHWPGFFLGAVESKADAAYIAAASPDVTIALLDALDAATARALAAEEALADGAIPAMRFAAARLSALGDDSTATDLRADADKIAANLNRTASGDEGWWSSSSQPMKLRRSSG